MKIAPEEALSWVHGTTKDEVAGAAEARFPRWREVRARM